MKMACENGHADGLTSSSLRRKYEYLFLLMILAVLFQLYMEYTFYMINQTELNKIHQLMQSKLLENEHVGMKEMLSNIPNQNIGFQTQSTNVHQQTQEETVVKLNPVIYEPKCEITSKEASSAIIRTGVQRCKQDIADIACQKQDSPIKALSRSCPLKGENGGNYLGCYQDSRETRLLSREVILSENNTVENCINLCLASGTNYAGLQYTSECWCGNSIEGGAKLDEEKCDHTCPGNINQKCGGELTLNVYETGFGKLPANELILNTVSNDNTIRIVFLLTLKGRAVRQVKQLFKMIYRPHHYYCLHIDSSEKHMFRELSSQLASFNNVMFIKNRVDAIWIGPKMLTLTFNSFQEIFQKKEWTWDYIINISETDFPLRSIEDLVVLLTNNKGINFVQSSPVNAARFIKEKLLDLLFHECDQYIWHIGRRTFPNGLYVTGDSDRFCLHRNFVEYLLESTRELVVQLKEYYKHSMFPSQSFFSIVLLNSVFCTTAFTSNLHIEHQDDNRRFQCSCRSTSDWCVCPPQVYLEADFNSLLDQRNENSNKFFAHKFDATISQKILTSLAADMSQASKVSGQPGLHSFWLNIFHHENGPDDQHDASYFTYYHSLIRKSLSKLNKNGNCKLKLQNITEVNVFMYEDIFQGLVIQFKVLQEDNMQSYIIESFVNPLVHFKKQNTTGPAAAFKHCQVGNEWDKKDQVFRNYGKFLGPLSKITLVIEWYNGTAGLDFTINIVYIDPEFKIAGSFELPVKSNDVISTHTPSFNGPLRPGVWNVQLLINWQLFVQSAFIIIPISHTDASSNKLLAESESKTLHSGPPNGVYFEQDLQFMKIQHTDNTDAKKQAEENSRKTGIELLNWVDKLSDINYEIKDNCISSNSNHPVKPCESNTEVCEHIFWSSLSPDPKSDLKDIILPILP